jgi:hypothetical protein
LSGRIYRDKHWGGDDHDFYSDTGSHTPEVIEHFIAAVGAYLSTIGYFCSDAICTSPLGGGM